jgi:hypothetical protein
MHKSKDEKELSKLHNALEDAFKRFKVYLSPRNSMPPLSEICLQVESHVRIQNALRTLLTDAETGAFTTVGGKLRVFLLTET